MSLTAGVEKVLQGLKGSVQANASGVAALTHAVAQLLSAPPGSVPTLELQRSLQHTIQFLLDTCGHASHAGDLAIYDAAKDALQLVSWQMVTRGQGDQRIFIGKLLEGLRPDHPTPHIQRTALEVASALCKVIDSSLQPVLLSGFAVPLSTLLRDPTKYAPVAKVVGDCARQFAPCILPGSPDELYNRLLEATRSLLVVQDDAVRRQAACAVAAVVCAGRPSSAAAVLEGLAARWAELDVSGANEEARSDACEGKGIALTAVEVARTVAAGSNTLPHALVPALKCLGALTSDVIQRFASLQLQDVSVLTVVLDSFETLMGLVEGEHAQEVLRISGWGDRAAEQLEALVPWLETWGGKGFERAVASCLQHVGLLVVICPAAFVDQFSFHASLTRTAGHDDTSVKCAAVFTCGRAATGLARAGHLAHALHFLHVVTSTEAKALEDVHRCSYTQKGCLQALTSAVPALLRQSDRACFVGAQRALVASLCGHAAVWEVGRRGVSWTVLVELLELCVAVPWRLLTEPTLVDIAMWWCVTLCCHADGRVRARACDALTALIGRLPHAVSLDRLHPPNRLRAATTDVPGVRSGYTAAGTLTSMKTVSDPNLWHANAALLVAENATMHNITEAMQYTLQRLAVSMGGMSGHGGLPEEFMGKLRVLCSISKAFGHAEGACRSVLALQSESAVNILLAALSLMIAQPHPQLKPITEVLVTMSGFISGCAGYITAATYRTLLVKVAMQWSLVTAAIAQRVACVDKQCPPAELMKATASQLAACGLSEDDLASTYVNERTVSTVAGAKAMAHKVVYRSTAADVVPEGFAGLCEACLTLLTSLVEEAADQALVCTLTDALLRVVALHRSGQPALVLGLLHSMFRTSYGHPDPAKQRVPLPPEGALPAGAVKLARTLKASPNAAPLNVFLNPILEAVQLYFKSMDARVQPAVIRLLHGLHCRGVDFTKLDPTREIASRLHRAAANQMVAWEGAGQATETTQLTPPITQPAPLLRLLHQILPSVAKDRGPLESADVVAGVLRRAEQASCPQLAESLLPLLTGPGASSAVAEAFLANLDGAMPCGGYALALCSQLLRGGAGADAAAAAAAAAAAHVGSCCELEWMGFDHGPESVDALCELCRLLARAAGGGAEAAAATLRAQLAEAGDPVSLAALLCFGPAEHSAVVTQALLRRLADGSPRLGWLERHGAQKVLSLLDAGATPEGDVRALFAAMRGNACADPRLASSLERYTRRAVTRAAAAAAAESSGEAGSGSGLRGLFATALETLEALLRPWVCDGCPPPVPSSALLRATLLNGVLLNALAAPVGGGGGPARTRGGMWKAYLTSPAALLCGFLRCSRDHRTGEAVAAALRRVRGGAGHPAVDEALWRTARVVLDGDRAPSTRARLRRHVLGLVGAGVCGAKVRRALGLPSADDAPRAGAVADPAPWAHLTLSSLVRSTRPEAKDCVDELLLTLPPAAVARAALAVPAGGAKPETLAPLFASLVGGVRGCLEGVLQTQTRGEAGGSIEGDTSALQAGLEAVALFARDHFAAAEAAAGGTAGGLAATVHTLLVAFCAGYDGWISGGSRGGVWCCTTVATSLFALAHACGASEYGGDALRQREDGQPSAAPQESGWSAVAKKAGGAEAGKAEAAAAAVVPRDVAWHGFVRRAARHFAAQYGAPLEHGCASILPTAEAFELALRVTGALVLSRGADDRRTVALVLGWEVCKAAPSVLYEDAVAEAKMAIEDGVGLAEAIGRLQTVVAGVGCPKPWDSTVFESVLHPLLAVDAAAAGGAEPFAAGVRLAASVVCLAATRDGPAHRISRPTSVVGPFPFVLTELLCGVSMLTPRECSGVGPWQAPPCGTQRNAHWPAPPTPVHAEAHAAALQAVSSVVKAAEVLSRANKVPAEAVLCTLHEVTVMVAACAPLFADSAASTALLKQVNAMIDRLPKETVPLRDYMYPLQGDEIKDCLADAFAPPGEESSAPLIVCADPVATECAAVLYSVLGATKDAQGVLLKLAEAHLFAAPAYALCTAEVARLAKPAALEKLLPALAARVRADVAAAYELPPGLAHTFSAAAEMLAVVVGAAPGPCEEARYTRNVWEALWPVLSGEGEGLARRRLSTPNLAGLFSQAYGMLLHGSLSQAQRAVIVALSSGTPPSPTAPGQAELLSAPHALLELGLMLCAQFPAATVVAQLDDDASHRHALGLARVLREPVLRKQGEAVVAAVGFIARRGLHWQQGMPLCLHDLLLGEVSHPRVLPVVLPRVLRSFFAEQGFDEHSWVWVQALMDGCAKRRGDSHAWTVSVVLASVCAAVGCFKAEQLLWELSECCPVGLCIPSEGVMHLRRLAASACALISERGAKIPSELWDSTKTALLDNMPEVWRGLFEERLSQLTP